MIFGTWSWSLKKAQIFPPLAPSAKILKIPLDCSSLYSSQRCHNTQHKNPQARRRELKSKNFSPSLRALQHPHFIRQEEENSSFIHRLHNFYGTHIREWEFYTEKLCDDKHKHLRGGAEQKQQQTLLALVRFRSVCLKLQLFVQGVRNLKKFPLNFFKF